MEKKNYNFWLSHWRLLLTALFVGLSANAWAQDITQTGVVLDVDGEGVIGATVMVKGTSNGVATDIDGNFSINCKKDDVLSIASVGYKSVEVKATGSELKITMVEDSELLDEVVVVGYGTMNKKHVAGSMTSISENMIEQ